MQCDITGTCLWLLMEWEPLSSSCRWRQKEMKRFWNRTTKSKQRPLRNLQAAHTPIPIHACAAHTHRAPQAFSALHLLSKEWVEWCTRLWWLQKLLLPWLSSLAHSEALGSSDAIWMIGLLRCEEEEEEEEEANCLLFDGNATILLCTLRTSRRRPEAAAAAATTTTAFATCCCCLLRTSASASAF